jgi:hypothetical protein
MGTTVEIPIRVRLDAAALGDGVGADALVADALRAAAGRALARAVATAGRGAAEPPWLHWTGEPLAASERARVERAVRDALAVAFAAAMDRSHDPQAKPAAAAGAPSEPADPERLAAALRRYVVPEYEDAGAPVALELQGADVGRLVPATTFIAIFAPADPNWSDDEWVAAFEAARVECGLARPGHGVMALMHAREDLESGVPAYGLEIFAVAADGAAERTGGRLAVWRLSEWVADELGRIVEQPAPIAASAYLRFRFVGNAGSPHQRRAIRERHTRTGILAAFDREAERLRQALGDAELQRLRDAAVAEAIAAIADDPRERGYIELLVDDRSFLVPLTEPTDLLAPGTEVPIVPLRTYVLAPPSGPDAGEGGRADPEATGAPPQVCEPFLGEPSVDELGADGAALRHMITAIARALGIAPCEFAGNFARLAAAAIAGRAATISELGATGGEAYVRPVTGEAEGNLGAVDFEPAPSPAIADLRMLASVVPAMTALVERICAVYAAPEHRGAITSFRDPWSWILRFRPAVNGDMVWAVGVMFAVACRVLLLQLLTTSAAAINARRASIGAYAELFDGFVLPVLRDIDTLIDLRERLLAAGAVHRDPAGPDAAPVDLAAARRAWLVARDALLDVLAPGPVEGPGEIVRDETGATAARDARGRLWTLDALERAVVERRGWLEELDPFVKQLADLDEVLDRFAAAEDGVEGELRRLLDEMLENNRDQTRRVESDWLYAFRAGRISEALPGAAPSGWRYALRGIHLQAHLAIGDAFVDDPYYRLGREALFSVELGRAGILEMLEFSGTLLLSIVCPPAGALLGIGTALADLEAARRRERLYASLTDPELVLSRAEVEVDMFVARLGLVLAVLPELPGAARAGMRVGRQAARAGARAAAREVGERLVAEMLERVTGGLALQFARELLTNEVIEAVATQVLTPIIAEIEREATITGSVGGEAGASALLEQLLAASDRGGPAPEDGLP